MAGPSPRVRALLSDTGNTLYPNTHPPKLFIQMDELDTSPEGGFLLEWQETRRWIRYEEEVEGQGERWSKPHVSTVSLQAIQELKQELEAGCLMIDSCDSNMAEVVDSVVRTLTPHYGLSEVEADLVRTVLSHPHRPQIVVREQKGKRQWSNTPLLQTQKSRSRDLDTFLGSENEPGNDGTNFQKSKVDKRFTRKLPSGAETANIFVGEIEGLSMPLTCFIHFKNPFMFEGVTEVISKTRFLFIVLGPKRQTYARQYREMGRAMGTLLCDEVFHQVAYCASCVDHLVDGIEEFQEKAIVLPPTTWTGGMRIDPPNVRPHTRARDLKRLRRPIKDDDLDDDGSAASLDSDDGSEYQDEHEDAALQRTGRLFGGLVADVRRRLPWYASDYKDALHLQCISSIIFLYFAAFTPIVTFGALMGEGTHEFMGTIECILAGGICGVIYHIFSGQALTVLGPTGPMFVLEVIVFHFAEDHQLNYMSFRLWIGLWTALFLLVLVAFDLSALVAYITRFTEESFASLISAIFVYDAIKKLADIRNYQDTDKFLVECVCRPPDLPPDNNLTDSLMSNGSYLVNGTLIPAIVRLTTSLPNVPTNVTTTKYISSTTDAPHYMGVGDKECFENNGTLVGCHHVGHSREIFHLSILWFLLTFTIATVLHWFRSSRFFPSKIRTVISDFCVFIAILVVSGADAIVGIHTPKLVTPGKFAPSHPDRGWLVPPLNNLPWWAPLAASLPAIIATILMFMDQQITAVIVNRKDNKMRKGCGYHLDLLVVAVLVVVCSVLGLPWYVASTVVAITHVTSLRKESECTAPGDYPQFIGIREQRVTGIVAHLMIGLSILFTPLLKRVPLPVLYGVFLYMGVSSLNGLELVERILLLFMPAKYQPEHSYVRSIPARRVHLFTAIQIICLIMLLVIKKIKIISMGFPIMVLGLCFVRNVIIERIFTPYELRKLDQILPNKKRRRLPRPDVENNVKKGEELQELNANNKIQEKDEMAVKAQFGDKNIYSLAAERKQVNGTDSGVHAL